MRTQKAVPWRVRLFWLFRGIHFPAPRGRKAIEPAAFPAETERASNKWLEEGTGCLASPNTHLWLAAASNVASKVGVSAADSDSRTKSAACAAQSISDRLLDFFNGLSIGSRRTLESNPPDNASKCYPLTRFGGPEWLPLPLACVTELEIGAPLVDALSIFPQESGPSELQEYSWRPDAVDPASIVDGGLSIALIGPSGLNRKAACSVLARYRGAVVREFPYPETLGGVQKLHNLRCDVYIFELADNPDYALELVESICTYCAATVFVYSPKTDSELLLRCMRAGAREFLKFPLTRAKVDEALVRASARRSVMSASKSPSKKGDGKILAFTAAKGGSGVTTLATNFAVALAQESGESTLLIDLDLPLGDAALNLGIAAQYSTVNALQDFNRLDSILLSKLLVKHSSGLSVLAAPGKYPSFAASDEAVHKLLVVARQQFDNVIVDAGSRPNLIGTEFFKNASTIYLLTQLGVPELRNSNRLISQFFPGEISKLEIVLNRYERRSWILTDDRIAKTLSRPARWKIPNDYQAVRKMQNTGIPLALGDSPISQQIRRMSRSVWSKAVAEPKRRAFHLFG